MHNQFAQRFFVALLIMAADGCLVCHLLRPAHHATTTPLRLFCTLENRFSRKKNQYFNAKTFKNIGFNYMKNNALKNNSFFPCLTLFYCSILQPK
jgi:hypothetical protein